MPIQSYLSGTTTLDVKKEWSFQTGCRSRQVQFAWNSMVNRNFHKLETGLSREGGLFRRRRFRQVLLYHTRLFLLHCKCIHLHVMMHKLAETGKNQVMDLKSYFYVILHDEHITMCFMLVVEKHIA